MLVTEAEAAGKECCGPPVVRAAIEAGVKIYEDMLRGCGASSTPTTCGGSRCMAWVWKDIEFEIDPKRMGPNRRGFCGLVNAKMNRRD
jgi:hypothetical protein